MDKTLFDAGSFVEIDLDTGAISSAAKDQLALIPTSVLQALEPGGALDEAAVDWGRSHGRLLAKKVNLEHQIGGLESLASHLGGTLAAFGMGRLSIEIRGDALTFRAKQGHDIAMADGVSLLLEGFLSGYLSSIGTYPFSVVYLGRDHGDRIFWAGNAEVAIDVRRLKSGGAKPLDIVEALISGDDGC